MRYTNRIFTFLLALMLSCSGDSLFEVDPQNESPDSDAEISLAKRGRGINQIMFHTDGPGDLAANGPIEVHAGASTSNPRCVVWELLDGETGYVNNGPAANGKLGARIMIERAKFLLNVVLLNVRKREVCTIEYDPNNRQKAALRDAAGNVLLTVSDEKIFAGNSAQDGANELLYTFKRSHVLDGRTHEILMTADAEIERAAAWRKLAIAALAQGYCGGNGLPQR